MFKTAVAALALLPAASAANAFDFYVYATSWQPEFCHGQASYDGCKTPDDLWKSQLTIHGMWPEFKDGTYPQTCSTESK